MNKASFFDFSKQHGFFADLDHNEEPDTLPYEEAELYAQHAEEEDPPQAGSYYAACHPGCTARFMMTILRWYLPS